MRYLVLALVVSAAGVSACGGDSDGDRVLRLSSGNTTEAELRLSIRADLARPGAEDLCRSLRGLSDKETSELVVQAQEGLATPVQEPSEADRERAGGILKEECDQVF